MFVYTLLLKRTTPQNIVIGGAAGALPPMIGWAAVTGSVTLPAILLFALVFYWTPPHFWALALRIIHVEPYQLSYANGRLQPVLDANNRLQTVPAADAWGLPTEPWIFVVRRDGRVVGSFEAVVAPSELTSAVDKALAGG